MRLGSILPWLFCGLITLSGLLPDAWVEPWEFNHHAINQGQVWRIFSGQWVHFGFNHSLMNGACLAMVQYQLLAGLKLRTWLLVQLAIQAVVGLGLYFLSSKVEIYRGYSGAFCGILAVGLLLNIGRDGWLLLLVYAGLLFKILLEQAPDYNIHYLQNFIGVDVATDAHLFGFSTGTLIAIICLVVKTRRNPAVKNRQT